MVMAVHVHVDAVGLRFVSMVKQMMISFRVDASYWNTNTRKLSRLNADNIKKMHDRWQCLEDREKQLLELSVVPVAAAAADGVVADDDLPGGLGLRQRVPQILAKSHVVIRCSGSS